jgi:thiamine-phosphate pyrophosphorylase
MIMNDRPDLALLSRANGVHVGQDELVVRDVKRIVGGQMLIGVSTHTIEQARQAVQDGANYIGCGPTFPSSTKQFEHFPGLDFLRQVAAEIALPAFAIGGITTANLSLVLATGFKRIAVGGAIAAASDIGAEATRFLKALSG